MMHTQQTIKCGSKLLNLSSPVVMGIVNLTPDSFYDGGKFKNENEIVATVHQMLINGAAIIDVGAASSKPGAALIDAGTEQKRLLPVAKILTKEFPEAVFSIDTYNSDTALKAVESGFQIVNDISGGAIDKKMIEVIASVQVPYIIMHMQGIPETMQINPQYDSVTIDIIRFFSEKVELLRSKLVNDIIIDPGFGFGKTVEHNFSLLKNLELFKMFNCPVLAGLSRKSMINKVLKIKPDAALNGTTVLNTIALMNGANILRVHDVAEAVEAIHLFEAYKNAL